jgi:ATPase subunit of ABC transporter with duplicated ATPase domains
VLIAGAPSEQIAVMAKRKKQAATRRGNAATRGKARKHAKSVRGKTAKRTNARAKSKKRVTKAKSKRAMAKKAVPTVETVIVDMIEEPVPGVMVVTEFEATGITGPKAKLGRSEQSPGAAPPEAEER